MKPGLIVLVEYPFTDRSGSKMRPALVVSNEEFNSGEDLVVVPISSARQAEDAHVIAIESGHPAFPHSGLRFTSYVKWTKPLTISRRVIRRKLGVLSEGLLSDVRAKLQQLFAA